MMGWPYYGWSGWTILNVTPQDLWPRRVYGCVKRSQQFVFVETCISLGQDVCSDIDKDKGQIEYIKVRVIGFSLVGEYKKPNRGNPWRLISNLDHVKFPIILRRVISCLNYGIIMTTLEDETETNMQLMHGPFTGSTGIHKHGGNSDRLALFSHDLWLMHSFCNWKDLYQPCWQNKSTKQIWQPVRGI